ncbi:hypothetical protein BpHYR1_026286 [Brachionus plicatilis]|uniref:Uncharacterized protein n=1 Tax=Brachionus plicatilis TaxID=10195 RepID=A0A3M7Q9S3_BRAPC|nr:hypothetical protein BpHYR1_026286 [Brachionus plicatilis]
MLSNKIIEKDIKFIYIFSSFFDLTIGYISFSFKFMNELFKKCLKDKSISRSFVHTEDFVVKLLTRPKNGITFLLKFRKCKMLHQLSKPANNVHNLCKMHCA